MFRKVSARMVLFSLLVIILLLFSCKSADLEEGREMSAVEVELSQTELIYNELTFVEQRRGNRGQAEKFHKMAALRYRLSDYSGAEQLWYEAVQSDPAWGEAYYYLASMAALQDHMDIAINYCLIAVKLSDGELLERINSDVTLVNVSSSERFRNLLNQEEVAN